MSLSDDEALEMLEGLGPPSRTVRTPDGAVVFEWHRDGEYIEVEATEEGVEWMIRDKEGRYSHGELPYLSGRPYLPPPGSI